MKSFLHKNRYQLLLLTPLAILPFLNTLNNQFVSDDIFAFVNSNHYNNFWIQAKTLSFAKMLFSLNYIIAGQNVFLYHFLSILFHFFTVITVYIVLSLIFNRKIAFFSAGFFAVHPIQTEVVTWISARPYSTSTFIVLLSFLFLILGRGKFWYSLALLFFILAIFDSEKAAVLPLLILLYLLYKGKLKTHWRLVLPFLGIAFFYGFYLLLQTKSRIDFLDKTSPSFGQSLFYNPLLQIPTAISSYLALLVWPKNLTLYHEGFNLTPFWLAIRSFATLIFFASFPFFWKKDKKIFFALSFFLINLLPSIMPIKVAWIVAERYVYLASLGFFIILALLLKKLEKLFQIKNLSYILFFSLIAVYSFLTIQRNNDWQNQDTLWLATVKASPTSAKAHNNMGDVYGRQGNLEMSLAEFQKAIELNPDYADATHNIGNTYLQMGNLEKAVEFFQKAIDLNPHLEESYVQLAAIFIEQKDFAQAESWVKKGLSINPNSAKLYNTLGVIEFKKGNLDKAKNNFQKAVEIDPKFIPAKKNLEIIEGVESSQ